MSKKASISLAVLLTAASSAVFGAPAITLIDEDQFGADWPFTQPEMHLSCLPGSAVVVMDVDTAAMYPLNGPANQQAKRHGMKPLNEIWRDNPEIPGTKVGIGPVIEHGLKLCK